MKKISSVFLVAFLAIITSNLAFAGGLRVQLNQPQRVIPNLEIRTWGGITLSDIRFTEVRDARNGLVTEYQLTVLKKPASCAVLGQGCGASVALYIPTKVGDACSARARVLSSQGKWKLEAIEVRVKDKEFLDGEELHTQNPHSTMLDITKKYVVVDPDAEMIGALITPYSIGSVLRLGGLGSACSF